MESIEQEEKFRYTMYPIEYPELWDMYIKLRSSMWTPEEIKEELTKDTKGWHMLEPKEQHFIKQTLAFFMISDGVVNETIEHELQSRIKIRPVKTFYGAQTYNEDIHSETYSMLGEIYFNDPSERNKMFDAINHFPAVRRKVDWIHKWVGHDNAFRHIPTGFKSTLQRVAIMFQKTMGDFLAYIDYATELEDPQAPIPKLDTVLNMMIESDSVPLGQVILANCIVEGLFFSGSFASIFWVNHYHSGLLPGLAKANQWISRDEGMHTDFAIMLYRRYIKNHLSQIQVHQMFREAVDVETDFVATALPSGLKGMNFDLMTQYVQFVADQLLQDLGYQTLYGQIKNPLDFMDKQSVSVRIADFFIDQNVSEYALAQDNGLSFGEDF